MRFFSTISIAAFIVIGSALGIHPVHAADNLEEALVGPRDPNGKGDATLTLPELMEAHGVPGLSVAVLREFAMAETLCFGIADVETGEKVTPETLFQAASISKPVAAMATLKAVQDGRFGVDDDINSILTSWQLPENEFTKERPITPAMLLSHTGGTTMSGFPGYDPSKTIPTAVEVLIGKRPANTTPVFVDIAPESKWRYSGGGVTVMQVALTDAIGKPYPEIVRTFVLEPLGMTNSTFEQPLPEEWDARAARAHNMKGKAMRAKWHVYPEMAAAGLWTTPTDLCTFAREVQLSRRGESNRVLTRSTIEAMVTRRSIGTYGLGFNVKGKPGAENYFGHSGGNWGFKSDLSAHMDKGYGAAIMTNGDIGYKLAAELKRRIAEFYGWDRGI